MSAPVETESQPTPRAQFLAAAGELKARLDRCEVLRGAGRAIAPSLPRSFASRFECEALTLALKELLDQIGGFEGQGDAPSAGGLESVLEWARRADAELDARGQELRGLTDGISFPQLRATLPSIAQRRRFDVLALLDIVVQDEQSLTGPRAQVFEYLITLLSTENDGSVRRVARDPASLIPRLEVLGERMSDIDGAEVEAVAQTLSVADDADEPPDLSDVLERGRELKQRLGPMLLVPDVQRALVSYNTEVGNKLTEELDAESEKPSGGSVLAAFEAAFDDGSLPSAAGSEALTPELVSTEEEAEAGSGDRPTDFGFDLLGEGLALGEPEPPRRASAESARPGAAEPSADPAPVSPRPAPPPDSRAAYMPSDRPTMPQRGASPAAPRPTTRAPSTKLKKPGRGRVQVLAVAVFVFGAIALTNLVRSGPSHIDDLAPVEIGAISPHLSSAYEDERNAGLFVGRVGPSWADLSGEDRHAQAVEIVARISQRGASEIMLYDEQLRLRVHATGDAILVPAAP